MGLAKRFLYLIFLNLLITFPAIAETELSSREKVELTVYNQDFALVKERRRLDLKIGENQISLKDVAAQIDPTSVHFKSLTAPESVRILEQNYEYDMISYAKLLEKYLGKEVEIHTVVDNKTDKTRITMAKLLSTGYTIRPQYSRYGIRSVYTYDGYGGRALYEIDGKIHSNLGTVGSGSSVVLPKLPEELIMRPTLTWLIESGKAGRHDIELSYMTGGIKWLADYVLVLNNDDTEADMTGWMTLDNRSGSVYENASLKLIAGDVATLAQPGKYKSRVVMEESHRQGRIAPQFKEKSFFEYHIYTLQRPVSIKNMEVKQIEFTRANHIKVSKKYVYDGHKVNPRYYNRDYEYYRTKSDYSLEGQTSVWVTIRFKNTKKNRLGIPLPGGRVRLYKEDEDKSQQFVGEDAIKHTPKDETIDIYAGNAFDIVGERKQMDFKYRTSDYMIEETFEIFVRNHKPEDVSVTVREHLYRSKQWKILKTNRKYNKKDSRTIEFPVNVPKDGETKITYTVRYTW